MTPKLKQQLAQMTKEQKLSFLSALEERARRDKEKRAVYAPNAGQFPVHSCPAILRAVFTGNGGGKTAMAVNEALAAALGHNPWLKQHTQVPCRVYVVLDRPDKIDNTWLPELKKWTLVKPEQLHKRGKPYFSEISFPNGSVIRFMFHEMEPLAFESIEADFIIFDEPPPRHVYVAMRRAGRTKGRQARYLIIGTPISAAWLRTDIYEPWSKGEAPDTECFRFATEVNRSNLAEGYIEQFGAVLSEKEKQVRLFGSFFDTDGLALAHLFRRDIHILSKKAYQWDLTSPCVVAIDCHPSKKHVAVLMGADEYGPVYIKELAVKATPRDFARQLKTWYQGFRLVDIVCDDLGSGQGTGGDGFKSFIQVLQEEGIRVRPTTYKDKHDEDWISRLQDALQIPEEPNNFGTRTPKLRILEGNAGVTGDIETVQWTKYRNLDEYKPTLDIGAKDFLACVKYALACNLHRTKHKDKAFYVKKKVYGINLLPNRRRRSAVS